jgi:hypothetical protein
MPGDQFDDFMEYDVGMGGGYWSAPRAGQRCRIASSLTTRPCVRNAEIKYE